MKKTHPDGRRRIAGPALSDYVKAAVTALGIAAFAVLLRCLFKGTFTVRDCLAYICDGLTVSGAVLLTGAVFSTANFYGFFDVILYGFSDAYKLIFSYKEHYKKEERPDIITWRNKKQLKRFIRYEWYAAAVVCLLSALTGIAVFSL